MNDILTLLKKQITISYDQSFELAKYCSNLLCSNDHNKMVQGRKIIIHVLDNFELIPKVTYSIWTDLIESVGFYPYLEKNKLSTDSLADEIRKQSCKSDYLENKYMHIKQKELSDLLKTDKNVVASAPTSFGKSLLIEEIVASHKYKNIIIIQPTLALLDETRIKLRKYSDNYKIIVRTSQTYSESKGNIFLLTAERVIEYEKYPHIDLLVIDEFYKLSLRRKDDRANILNNAFLRIVNTYNAKFYMLGPNIDGITKGFEEKYNATFYKSDYSLVDCDITNINVDNLLEAEKKKKLFDLLYDLKNEQTLIYCSSPSRARKYAKEFMEYIKEKNEFEENHLPIIKWIEENISTSWSLVDELKKGIAFHDGSLQKHIGASIISYFNKNKLKYIFCTSTIIEGVNTSAKNVIIYDSHKGNKDIDFFDYSNIKGRSGRMMIHYVGKIYNFIAIPNQQQIIVDIPFFEQNKDIITDEILINIPEKDVKHNLKERYDSFKEIPSDLFEIIKKNGVSVDAQMYIYNYLENHLENINLYTWSQMPTYNQILDVLKLADNKFFTLEKSKGIYSVSQLTFYLNRYRTSGNMKSIINLIFESKKANVKKLNDQRIQNYYDQSIELAFHIYRHWFQYTIPKVFRVIDSLQRYVCEKHNLKPGSYSYFVQQLESDFLKENVSILVEYGLPQSSAKKIEKIIGNTLTEDEVIEFIKKNSKKIMHELTEYECERLIECII